MKFQARIVIFAPKWHLIPPSKTHRCFSMLQKIIHFQVLIIHFLAPLQATNYYVAPTGNDTHFGSLAQPFLTIQRGLDAAQAGDTVWVRAGVYPELLVWPRSGMPNRRIVLANYPGEQPAVDGTGLNGAYLLRAHDKSHLVVRGLEFRNFAPRVEPGQFSGGVMLGGQGRDWTVSECLFHHIAAAVDTINRTGALRVWSSGGPIRDVLIQKNTFRNNSIGQGAMVSLLGDVADFVVEANVAHDNLVGPIFQCAGGYAHEFLPGFRTDTAQARRGVFRANTARDNEDRAFAFHADGARDILFERNVAQHNAVGFRPQAERLGVATVNVRFQNNILINNFSGVELGRDPNEVPLPKGRMDSVFFVNNLVFVSYQALVLGGRCRDVFVENNLFVLQYAAFGAKFIVWKDTAAANLRLDHNLYYGLDGVLDGKFEHMGNTYFGLDAYRAVSGNEPNGLYADPRFEDVANFNFHLQAGSPAIDAGNNTYAPTADYDGLPRPSGKAADIGPFEVQTVGATAFEGEALFAKVAPNPTTGPFTFTTSPPWATLVVHDASGTPVLRFTPDATLTLEQLPPGPYWLEACDNKGSKVGRLVVLMR